MSSARLPELGCAAVVNWSAEIPVGDVQQVVGILPATVIETLLAKVIITLPPGSEDEGGAKSEGSPNKPPISPET